MKASIKILSLLLIAGGLTFTSCKKDSTPALTLTSIMSAGIDLNGATSATGVGTSDNIVVVLSTNVDATTANSTNITLMRGSNSVATTITVTGNTITIDPTVDLLTGTTYTLSINNLKSDKGQALSAVTVSFTTTGVGLDTPPQKDSQVMYLQLNGNITDITGNATVSFQQVSWTTDRFGTANGAANFAGATAPGNGDLVELTGNTFINPSTTVSVWFKIAEADYIAPGNKGMFGIGAENGFFAEMGDGTTGPNWLKLATDHIVSPDPMSHGYGTAWNTYNGADVANGTTILFASSAPTTTLVQDGWHQFVMTYDNTSYLKTFFIDGAKIEQWSLLDPNGEWNLKDVALHTITGVDPRLALGFYCSKENTATGWADYSAATNTFKGALDDMRIWNKALTESEVATLYTSEKP